MAQSPSSLPHIPSHPAYSGLVGSIGVRVEESRHLAARDINPVITDPYREIRRRVGELAQGGKKRARYGDAHLKTFNHTEAPRGGRRVRQRDRQFSSLFYERDPQFHKNGNWIPVNQS